MDLSGAFTDQGRCEKLLGHIRKEATGEYRFMEVCGGHTAAIQGYGIAGMLPSGIRLVSGPGCPVCVTSRSYIDHAAGLAGLPDVTIATFGDLMKVPGTHKSLDGEKAGGKDIRIVYSVNEAINIAWKLRKRKVIFLAVGFETTAPGTAAGVLYASEKGMHNFFLLSAHKIMPPAMKAIVSGGTQINGFICPGHVSAITGSGIYRFLPDEHGIGCVISGFEPLDILQSVLMLVRQANRKRPDVEIQYTRAVKPEGNTKAVSIMNKVFSLSDEWWRGFGVIPGSGLQLREKFAAIDAAKVFPAFAEKNCDDGDCICGEILRGASAPYDCPLFGNFCNPENPAGACMVSSEGACNICFKYGKYA